MYKMAIIKDETDNIINSNEYKQILEVIKRNQYMINNLLQTEKIYKAEINLLNTQIDASVKFIKILKDEL